MLIVVSNFCSDCKIFVLINLFYIIKVAREFRAVSRCTQRNSKAVGFISISVETREPLGYGNLAG